MPYRVYFCPLNWTEILRVCTLPRQLTRISVYDNIRAEEGEPSRALGGPGEWHPPFALPNALPVVRCTTGNIRTVGLYQRVWVEASCDYVRSRAGIMDSLPLRLSEIILELWRYQRLVATRSSARELRCSEGTTTNYEIVVSSPRQTPCCSRDEELRFQYPEVTIGSPIVQEARDTSRREEERVPRSRARPSVAERPCSVLSQGDDRRAGPPAIRPTMYTATAIASTRKTTSAKGSPDAATVRPPRTIAPCHEFSNCTGVQI